MEWKSILPNKRGIWASSTIEDITKVVANHDFSEQSQGLMYGYSGIATYLFHASDSKGDDKLFEQATALVGQAIKQTTAEMEYASRYADKIDVSLDQGFAGIGWCMSYLLRYEQVEGDMDSIFGVADAVIFRRMVTVVQEPMLRELACSVGISLYAVNRDSRLSQEYLRRYVLELHERTLQPETKDKLLAQSCGTIAGLVRLMGKVADKYPDIACTRETADYLYDLLETLPTRDLDLKSLFVLLNRDNSRSAAMDELNRRARWTVDNAETMKVEAGLERGLAATAHTFNRVFQHTGDEQCHDAAVACFTELLGRATQTIEGSGIGLWNTSSRGLWCRHYGLLNGISGIGLALMAAVSDEEPTWDEILFLS